MTVKREEHAEIEWREWATHSFEEARRKKKLVLLDLTATWCHWCHVMDKTTYSDPTVAQMVNENFIPVRVDIDRRPDISDRYNRGGFPTTAFLSDQGESVWGATFVPPSEMKRIIGSILEAKESGKIDQALERNRLQFLDLAKSWKRPLVDSEIVDGLFEDIFSTYDVEYGGFGTSPKFPHPDVVELLMFKQVLDSDNEVAEAAIKTIDMMGAGLYDTVEGGVFRYSVTRDWREPHYEKMLETNLGYLRNLVHAHMLKGQEKHARLAKGVAKYIIDVLHDQSSGGFFGSQDADENYYRMTREMRSRRPAPSIDRAIYSGWNSEAVSTLVWAGILMGERIWIASAKKAWRHCVTKLWNPQLGLIRHVDGQEIYFFDDQVSFLGALLAVFELRGGDDLLTIGRTLMKAVDVNFADPEGGYGDILRMRDAIGELGTPRRPLVSNSKWAAAIALFGVAAHDSSLGDHARRILLSFNQQEAEAHGLFAASYIYAWWLLEYGPMLVEIHDSSSKNPLDAPLWMAAKQAMNPAAVVVLSGESEPIGDSFGKPFATICDDLGCSKEFTEPRTLAQKLSYKRA